MGIMSWLFNREDPQLSKLTVCTSDFDSSYSYRTWRIGRESHWSADFKRKYVESRENDTRVKVLSESCSAKEARRIAQEWGANNLSIRTVTKYDAEVHDRFNPWFLYSHIGVRVAVCFQKSFVSRDQWDDGRGDKYDKTRCFCIMRISDDRFKCIEADAGPTS